MLRHCRYVPPCYPLVICLLLPVHFHLSFYDLVVGSSGVVIGKHGPSPYRSVPQCQIDDLLAFMVLPCTIVCGSAIIPNFQSIVVNHHFPEGGIRLCMAPRIPPTAVGIKFSHEDGSALPIDSLPVHLLCLSLCRLRVSLIVNIENPLHLLPSPPDVSHHNIVVRTPV